jgi:uncharacterized membrane protein YoaK (UPF0700 family)
MTVKASSFLEKHNEKPSGQISDSLYLALVLAVSGGLMDAYTYIYRGHVFANAQTGNILLLGVHLSDKNWTEAAKYLFPILSFTGGIILAELIRHINPHRTTFHWRQAAILVEAMALFMVGFLPVQHNAIANALVSFSCGIQVESFRKVLGHASSTTMCIGNLRSGTQAICEFFFTKKRAALNLGFIYYGIIVFFVMGAILGNALIKQFGQRTIWCSSILMLVVCILMQLPVKERS